MIKNHIQSIKLIYNTIKNIKLNKIKLIITILLMILSNIFSLLTPLLFGHIINGIIEKSIDTIKMGLYFTILVFIASLLLNYITTIILNKILYSIDIDSKKNIFNAILNMSYKEYTMIDNGKLINNIQDDAIIYSSLVREFINSFIQFINIIISIFMMFYISPILSVLIFISFPITSVIHIKTGIRLKKKEVEYKSLNDIYISFLNESFNGWKYLKLFLLENKRSIELNNFLNKLYNLRLSQTKIDLISNIIVKFTTFIINLFNIIIAIYLIFNGKLTIGMFTSFNEYSAIVKNILLYFSELNYTFQKSTISILRINNLFKSNKNKEKNKIILKKGIQSITISNLIYNINDSIKLLENINLTFLKGNIYLLDGPSGSGKSTLLNILSGFIKYYKGEIFINEYNLKNIDTTSLRNSIVYITQDDFLFAKSIKENITLNLDISDDQIYDICKKLNLHHTIMQLKNGYETVIYEDGNDLSGGEKQRICIARGLIRNASIYLFDEVTSALDNKNTIQVLKLLETLSINSIVIIISHQNLIFNKKPKKYILKNNNFVLK